MESPQCPVIRCTLPQGGNGLCRHHAHYQARCTATGQYKCATDGCPYPAACPMGSTDILPHCIGCQHGDYTGLAELPGPYIWEYPRRGRRYSLPLDDRAHDQAKLDRRGPPAYDPHLEPVYAENWD